MIPLSEKGRKIGAAAITPIDAVAAFRCESVAVTPETKKLSSRQEAPPVAQASTAAVGQSDPRLYTMCETGPVIQAGGSSGTYQNFASFADYNTTPPGQVPLPPQPEQVPSSLQQSDKSFPQYRGNKSSL